MEPEAVNPTHSINAHDALSLDPTDWEELRSIGHQMLDDMIDSLRDVREQPTWQSPSAAARASLDAPLPREGRPLAEVYEQFQKSILPYPTGNIHPRFWGWVMGNGTPVGMLADLLGGAMNCHVSGYDQAATLVERRVIQWLVELMEMPTGSTGLLVSGGTMANLLGVAVARDQVLGASVKEDGVSGQTTAIYCSTETHGWVDRSADLLGLGRSAVRKIPVDADHRMKLEALRSAIAEDKANGVQPICIVGNAGTVACGATDALTDLAELAESEGLWLHIDGAFGALAKFAPAHRGMVDGLERADSVAFDLHKWGYMQYEQGVVLFRDGESHEQAFRFAPSYLHSFEGGIAPNPTEFASKGIQLSRGFRALKVWLQLSVYGSDAIGRIISRNIDDVQYLCELIDRTEQIERVGPAAMNVVCFRYVVPGLSDAELDALNAQLLIRIQESGIAVPSNAQVDGKFVLRVANTNHRTERSDFDLLVETVKSMGAALAREKVAT